MDQNGIVSMGKDVTIAKNAGDVLFANTEYSAINAKNAEVFLSVDTGYVNINVKNAEGALFVSMESNAVDVSSAEEVLFVRMGISVIDVKNVGVVVSANTEKDVLNVRNVRVVLSASMGNIAIAVIHATNPKILKIGAPPAYRSTLGEVVTIPIVAYVIIVYCQTITFPNVPVLKSII